MDNFELLCRKFIHFWMVFITANEGILVDETYVNPSQYLHISYLLQSLPVIYGFWFNLNKKYNHCVHLLILIFKSKSQIEN